MWRLLVVHCFLGGWFYSLRNTTDMGIMALTVLLLVTVSIPDFSKHIILNNACVATERDSNVSKLGIILYWQNICSFNVSFVVPESEMVYKNHILSQHFIFTKPSGIGVVQLLHFLDFNQGLLSAKAQPLAEGVHEPKTAERIREVALYAFHATLCNQYETFSGTKYWITWAVDVNLYRLPVFLFIEKNY